MKQSVVSVLIAMFMCVASVPLLVDAATSVTPHVSNPILRERISAALKVKPLQISSDEAFARFMNGEIEILWSLEDPDMLEVLRRAQQMEKNGILPLGYDQWEDPEIISMYGKRKYGENPNQDGDGLPNCGGYWGTQLPKPSGAGFAFLETDKNKYLFLWNPNCSFVSPCGDCGTDCSWWNGDDMVSFWMGPDYTWDTSKYRVTSISFSGMLFLIRKGGVSFRQYHSNGYGPWFGNAYVCWPYALNANDLRFGRIR